MVPPGCEECLALSNRPRAPAVIPVAPRTAMWFTTGQVFDEVGHWNFLLSPSQSFLRAEVRCGGLIGHITLLDPCCAGSRMALPRSAICRWFRRAASQEPLENVSTGSGSSGCRWLDHAQLIYYEGHVVAISRCTGTSGRTCSEPCAGCRSISTAQASTDRSSTSRRAPAPSTVSVDEGIHTRARSAARCSG